MFCPAVGITKNTQVLYVQLVDIMMREASLRESGENSRSVYPDFGRFTSVPCK